MVKRSHKLAEANGCNHTYIIATGKFSQRIFHKLDYKLIYEVKLCLPYSLISLVPVLFPLLQLKYSDIEKDKQGRPLIDDHGVHETIQTVLYSHTLKSPEA